MHYYYREKKKILSPPFRLVIILLRQVEKKNKIQHKKMMFITERILTSGMRRNRRTRNTKVSWGRVVALSGGTCAALVVQARDKDVDSNSADVRFNKFI